jgi:glucose/arabinose dehydrogenase
MQTKNRSCSRRWPGPNVTRSVVPLVLGFATLAAAPGSRAAEPPGDLQLVPVASGLTRPVAIRNAADGSGRLFLVEQAGVIKIWDGSQILATPFLDIDHLVEDGGNEQGLLGLAFHPDYSSNGYFFINYTRPPGSGSDETAVVRRQVSSGDPNVADTNPATIKDVIVIPQDFSNHNGGDIHFSPIDGYLYIGMGDGGSRGDPNNRALDLGRLLGKMLRLDIDPLIPTDPYDVPADNPFVGIAGLDEIWAYGLRNPWRWSFDRFTGDLLMGDVGQHCREEVNYQPGSSSGGENYGWDCREGTIPYDGDTGPGDECTNQPNAGSMCSGPLVEPFFDYDRDSGSTVTGGFVYRGSRISGLQGKFVFADYANGQIWFASKGASDNWTVDDWMNTPYSISTFGEDEAGELYLADFFAGTIYRFESPSSIFADGFDFGDPSIWSVVVP